MVIPRASILSRGFGRVALNRTSHAGRSQGWKQLGRRTYASGHGEQQSSELPWIIGSLAVTVPAAGWLLQQGPTKSDHGHDTHKEEHKDTEGEDAQTEKDGGEDQPAEESKDEEKGEEKKESKNSGDEGKEDAQGNDEKQKGDDSNEEKGEKTEEESQDEDDYSPPSPGSPGQINWKPGTNKGPGEGQKGERKPSERKGEKDSQGDHSGAKHPYIDDAEKSKKGNGVTETAKIHGTVDSKQSARGPNTGKSD